MSFVFFILQIIDRAIRYIFILFLLKMYALWQKWRSVAKRDNHPQMDVVKLAMLDLYCRQCLCWNSIQTLGSLPHVWTRYAFWCMSNFYFAPCVRTLGCAIVPTVRGLCCRLWYFNTLAFATTLKWICGIWVTEK